MLSTSVFPQPSADYLYKIFKLLLNFIFVNVAPQFMNGHELRNLDGCIINGLQGTSFAAPIAVGIIALALEAKYVFCFSKFCKHTGAKL
jgi:hypothetical protein